MRVALPSSIAQILRCPADEIEWGKLEHVREAIESEMQDETTMFLSKEERAKLADVIQRSTSRIHPDELTEEFAGLPVGTRVVVETHRALQQKPKRAQIDAARLKTVTAVRNLPDNAAVRVLKRPFDRAKSTLGFEIDPMGCEICQYGRDRKSLVSIAEENGYTQQEALDRMLLPLYDALLLRMALQWSKDGVTNLHVCQVYEVAKWWI